MDPTPEQTKALDLFATGGSLAIEAGAGTGKTSTLVMLAQAAKARHGQYVAFNKALVEESRAKFPLNVDTNTAHSLAFRAVGKHYSGRLNRSERVPGRVLAERMGMHEVMEATTFDGQQKPLYPGYLASLAGRMVTNFCQSADPVISGHHVPFVLGLDYGSVDRLRDYLVPHARTMWADLQNETFGWAPFKHEHYLKMYQLRHPRLAVDFILFDEAQDANPVIADIVAQQAQFGTQLVYVGDSQQEIYAWTGAVNALANIKSDHRTFLTQSFRFGQAIADRANEVLDTLQAELRLTGNPSINSRLEAVELPKAILVRTNATGIATLLQLQLAGRSVHYIGGGTDVIEFMKGAEALQTTGRSFHPDLALFDSWAAVQAYVSEDEGGEDLKLLVRLVDNFGAQAIREGLERMPNENRADIVISTAHKSKGREWSEVQLAGDFPQAADSKPADLRLLYVSVTRAKLVLDSTNLDGKAPLALEQSAEV